MHFVKKQKNIKMVRVRFPVFDLLINQPDSDLWLVDWRISILNVTKSLNTASFLISPYDNHSISRFNSFFIKQLLRKDKKKKKKTCCRGQKGHHQLNWRDQLYLCKNLPKHTRCIKEITYEIQL